MTLSAMVVAPVDISAMEKQLDVADDEFEKGRFREASRRFARVEAAVRRSRGIGAADAAVLAGRARLGRASLLQASGDFDEADQILAAVLTEARAPLGNGHMIMARALVARGVLWKAQGRYSEALHLYRRAERILQRNSDATTADMASLYHNLGGIEHARGNLPTAERYARRGIALRRRVRQRSHRALIADEAALAAILTDAKKLDQARRLYQRALAYFHRTDGPKSYEVGMNLANLAALEFKAGRAVVAERRIRAAVAALESAVGRQSPELVLTLHNHAVILKTAGKRVEAARVCKRALRIAERRLAPGHPERTMCRSLLVTLSVRSTI